MIPRGHATVMRKDCFNDPGVSQHIMYCILSAIFLSPVEPEKDTNCTALVEVVIGGGQRFLCDLIQHTSRSRFLLLIKHRSMIRCLDKENGKLSGETMPHVLNQKKRQINFLQHSCVWQCSRQPKTFLSVLLEGLPWSKFGTFPSSSKQLGPQTDQSSAILFATFSS